MDAPDCVVVIMDMHDGEYELYGRSQDLLPGGPF